jgi:hypothetical protein
MDSMLFAEATRHNPIPVCVLCLIGTVDTIGSHVPAIGIAHVQHSVR